MYFNFDFDRDVDFYIHSIGFKLIKCKIADVDEITKIEQNIVDACIKLWMESVIKNNLDMYTGKFDYLHLISEQNSTEVFNILGKIMWKDKNKITDADRNILKSQQIIQEYLQSIMYELSYDNIDLCDEIKKEFIQFKEEYP